MGVRRYDVLQSVPGRGNRSIGSVSVPWGGVGQPPVFAALGGVSRGVGGNGDYLTVLVSLFVPDGRNFVIVQPGELSPLDVKSQSVLAVRRLRPGLSDGLAAA